MGVRFRDQLKMMSEFLLICISDEHVALNQALGLGNWSSKGAMGRRKLTRLLNNIAAGYLDEEAYGPSDMEAGDSKSSSAKLAKHRPFFASVGYDFFDEKLIEALPDEVEGFSAEEKERAYQTEQELDQMLRYRRHHRRHARKSGHRSNNNSGDEFNNEDDENEADDVDDSSERVAFDRFRRVDRKIRFELKRLQDHTFLNELEQYLISFKFDELDPGSDFSSEYFHVWSPASLSIDVSMLPHYARPVFLEFKSTFHRLLSHGVSQFHSLLSKSANLRGRRVTIVRRMASSSFSSSSIMSSYQQQPPPPSQMTASSVRSCSDAEEKGSFSPSASSSSSSADDAGAALVNLIEPPIAIAGVSYTSQSLCQFLKRVQALKADQHRNHHHLMASVKPKQRGGKYAAFARRFGEKLPGDSEDDVDEEDTPMHAEQDDDHIEVGSPARMRPSSRSSSANKSAIRPHGSASSSSGSPSLHVAQRQVERAERRRQAALAEENRFEERFNERFSVVNDNSHNHSASSKSKSKSNHRR